MRRGLLPDLYQQLLVLQALLSTRLPARQYISNPIRVRTTKNWEEVATSGRGDRGSDRTTSTIANLNSRMEQSDLQSLPEQQKEHTRGILCPEVSTRHQAFNQQLFSHNLSATYLALRRLRLGSQPSIPQIQCPLSW